MDLAINPAVQAGAAQLWLHNGQLTRLDEFVPAVNEQARQGQTRVLLWPQQADIKPDMLIHVDGLPYRVEAVESLILHFCRVLRLTLRMVGGDALRIEDMPRTKDLDVVAGIATPSNSPSCEAVLLR